MDWRAEAVKAVQSFDDALGRPPFPFNPPDDLIEKANAIQRIVEGVVNAGKTKLLDGVAEVTTTLPILCASLREGSPDRTPSLALYRPLLRAVGLVSALSTYPISHLLSDAKSILGASVYVDEASASAKMSTTPTDSNAAGQSAETTADNEAALFCFMATSRSLTPEDMRRFLRLPPQAASPVGTSGKAKGSQGKGSGATNNKNNKGLSTSAPNNSKVNNKAGVTPTNVFSTVPSTVLNAMVEAALSDECRLVFESFIDSTQKFLAVVDGDGDLASRILAVYAARIVPKLKLSSLLPCLNASLLDYYVDIVAMDAQHENSTTLLRSKELRDIALRRWDVARLHDLAVAAATRPVQAEEALPSLMVCVFLYQVYCELTDRSVGGASETNTRQETSDEAVKSKMKAACHLNETEHLLIVSVLRALRAVLCAGQSGKQATSTSPGVYIQAKTGVLLVLAAGVSTWLEPFTTFVQLLLSRQTAATLCTPPHLAASTGFVENEARMSAGEVHETVTLLTLAVSSRLQELIRSAPKAEKQAIMSAQQQQSSGKSKGKAADNGKGKKGEISTTQPKEKVAAEVPPLPFSEVLSSYCASLLFALLVERSALLCESSQCSLEARDQIVSSLEVVVEAYAYLLQHQPQRLNTALWQNFLSYFSYCMWMHAADANGGAAAADQVNPQQSVVPSQDTLKEVLLSATVSTDVMLWLSPFVLPQRSSTLAFSVLAGVDVTALLSSNAELWLAVVQAVVNVQSATASALSPLGQQLFPASPACVLGSLCALVEDDVLQSLADVLVTCPANRSTVIVATLQRMVHNGESEETTAESPSPTKTSFFPQCVPCDVSQSGLKRLLDVVEILQAGHRAVQAAAEANAKVAAQRAMQLQLQRSREVSAAHRAFLAEAQAKAVRRAAEQAQIHAEVERRRAAAAARFHEDAAMRTRKRQSALDTLRMKAEQNCAQREAARRERFAAYQQRLESEYRVATFLEHLNLSSARVMATRDALRKVMDSITPDDLLEFLVSGKAKVPVDMLNDDNSEEADATAATVESTRAGSGEGDFSHATVADTAPRYVGERRDFWAEIMDNAAPAPLVAPSPAAPPASSASAAAEPAATAYRTFSFHKRIAPLLDLFFYEDGDEFGKVPEVLPTIRLRLAANVWPPVRTRQLGFANLREAFDQMRHRGLVQVQDGVVQLTLLGFRYHFPFHDPDGMLEVYLREARERVRALVALREQREADEDGEDSEGDMDEAGGEEEEEGEYAGEEEDEESDAENEDRLLPEVEFGI